MGMGIKDQTVWMLGEEGFYATAPPGYREPHHQYETVRSGTRGYVMPTPRSRTHCDDPSIRAAVSAAPVNPIIGDQAVSKQASGKHYWDGGSDDALVPAISLGVKGITQTVTTSSGTPRDMSSDGLDT